jgi:hypothetical protein
MNPTFRHFAETLPRTWSSPRYQQQARELAGQAGLQGRLHWRLHDLAEDPGAVAPADLVVLHLVVCCYPVYEQLLAQPPTMPGAP